MSRGGRRPHAQMRQSQLITTFGPGAMVDLPNHAVLIGGLEFWTEDRRPIHEERLLTKLEAALQKPGLKLYSPPIDDGECMSCHTPHASDRPFLFAGANQLEVCGNCHDWQQHSSHPLGDKAVDMRNPNLRVDCESCHRSHGTAFPHFAHADTKGDLCTQCHTQFTR